MTMPRRLLVCACGVHAFAVLAIVLVNALGPERWWWAGVNMFLPQWIWAIPSLALLPLSLFFVRRWLWLPAATLLCVTWPVMGLCWRLAPGTSVGSDGDALRVMTYNVQLWQRANLPLVLQEIQKTDPDILCLQDARAGPGTASLDDYFKTWHVAAFGQYLIASKFPIIDSFVGDISMAGEQHTYLRARIEIAGRSVTVSTAHFATPRDALSGFRSPEFWRDGVPLIRENLSHRMTQARALANDLRSIDGPSIVTGDLNAPPPSLAVRTLTDLGLVDAFAAGGRGYGYTFGHTLFVRHSFLRLDRILVSRHFRTVAAAVGGNQPSDHRPVIADLVLQR